MNFFIHSIFMAQRHLRNLSRQPWWLVISIVQPILWLLLYGQLFKRVVELPGFDALRDPPLQPVDVLARDHHDLFSLLDERDVLLHHPYDAYEPVIALLAQAAEDPEVLAIKQTLYRVSSGSPLVASLLRG